MGLIAGKSENRFASHQYHVTCAPPPPPNECVIDSWPWLQPAAAQQVATGPAGMDINVHLLSILFGCFGGLIATQGSEINYVQNPRTSRLYKGPTTRPILM